MKALCTLSAENIATAHSEAQRTEGGTELSTRGNGLVAVALLGVGRAEAVAVSVCVCVPIFRPYNHVVSALSFGVHATARTTNKSMVMGSPGRERWCVTSGAARARYSTGSVVRLPPFAARHFAYPSGASRKRAVASLGDLCIRIIVQD